MSSTVTTGSAKSTKDQKPGESPKLDLRNLQNTLLTLPPQIRNLGGLTVNATWGTSGKPRVTFTLDGRNLSDADVSVLSSLNRHINENGKITQKDGINTESLQRMATLGATSVAALANFTLESTKEDNAIARINQLSDVIKSIPGFPESLLTTEKQLYLFLQQQAEKYQTASTAYLSTVAKNLHIVKRDQVMAEKGVTRWYLNTVAKVQPGLEDYALKSTLTEMILQKPFYLTQSEAGSFSELVTRAVIMPIDKNLVTLFATQEDQTNFLKSHSAEVLEKEASLVPQIVWFPELVTRRLKPKQTVTMSELPMPMIPGANRLSKVIEKIMVFLSIGRIYGVLEHVEAQAKLFVNKGDGLDINAQSDLPRFLEANPETHKKFVELMTKLDEKTMEKNFWEHLTLLPDATRARIIAALYQAYSSTIGAFGKKPNATPPLAQKPKLEIESADGSAALDTTAPPPAPNPTVISPIPVLIPVPAADLDDPKFIELRKTHRSLFGAKKNKKDGRSYILPRTVHFIRDMYGLDPEHLNPDLLKIIGSIIHPALQEAAIAYAMQSKGFVIEDDAPES